MPGSDRDAADGSVPPKPSAWQRLLNTMVKPADSDSDAHGRAIETGADGPTTVAELEEAVRRADDKERLIGLLAAPIAAMIGLLVTGSLLANDPKVTLANGQLNKLHVSPSLYVELGAIAIVLAVVMLAMAWFRKRLYLGMTMALYGLSLFNLHYWGFGVPYILFGSWYLVRAYRLQSKLKLARAAEGGGPAIGGPGVRPAQSKRYTPPTGTPGKSPKPKPGNQRKAG
jgi:hypothetical protein